ncbi:MAG: hypothetical protein A2010_03740 [Nitrospirae bacterium GWD2_57_9]|nr:MAG: hypothetical protein A2010_03740 [Nitrospirae bacterium GWD2_57_9]OGW47981.1 MAG: hypothetical protein A2078_08940 [Nitrospirae bacterium GWC2_57_9]
MTAKVNIAGHPVHPMLVAFPIGLWVFSLACDIVFRATGNAVWDTVALYTMGGGIIGAVAAALPGFFDLLDMKESAAKRIGLGHALLNIAALVLFVASFSVRQSAGPGTVPFILSILGVITIMVSGWLGGSMVYLHGAAVELGQPQAGEPPREWKKAA